MEKVTIEKIFRDVVATKRGPGTKVSIYTTEQPGVRMTSFDDRATAGWKEGDVVEVSIEKNGNFTNFRTGERKRFGGATGSAPSSDVLAGLITRIEKLEAAVFEKDVVVDPGYGSFVPVD